MMRLKKLFTCLIACLCLSGLLLSTGCSENDIDKVVEIASVLTETEGAETASAAEKPKPDAAAVTQPSETEQVATASETTTAPPVAAEPSESETTVPPLDEQIPEDGEYLSMEQVSGYLHLYGHLPGNYLTKSEAKKRGWVASKGNLWDVAPGAAIGGDTFGNREGHLPKQKGRKYYECDVNYDGGRRGAERLVYSDDGLIYYTADHYNTFMQLFDGTEDQ